MHLSFAVQCGSVGAACHKQPGLGVQFLGPPTLKMNALMNDSTQLMAYVVLY